MSFGEVLKKIRTEKNDTVRSLAEKAGISYSFIGRVEKDTAPISRNFVDKIMKVYTDKENELLEAYMETKIPESISKKNKNLSKKSDVILIKHLLSEATPEDRKAVLELLVLQREVEARKNGTYEKRKDELDAIKKEIEKLK
ncbi:helix-turn-helix domain-containing protein [Fusobacterium ulcerans]|uniref:helix-turn-helix domain-containing protein n=1 Tax=Fusobacterium ulcerans TaxID=861 RepID=UPI0027B9DF60|nr:helix-turn-helix transcriptional regulator [Fusobacterium ulcerans]